MQLTVISHLTLDGVMQSNGKPEPELNDGFEQGGWQVPYLRRRVGPAGHELAGRGRRVPVRAQDLRAVRGRVEWTNSALVKGDLFEEVES